MAKEKVVLSWSGGKDCVLALWEILQGQQYEIAALMTTCTEGYERISMHGVRCTLLEYQAQALGLSLCKVFIPKDASNAVYETRMQEALFQFKHNGINKVVFGDIFLEDIRCYRERLLGKAGMSGIYPLWQKDTDILARGFVRAGFKSRLVCVNLQQLDESFAGRFLDETLLDDLPENVDPCGENGEFHTFVIDGPAFSETIKCIPGKTIFRDTFCFVELDSG